MNRYFNVDFSLNSKPKTGKFIQNCSKENLDNIFKEIYKRFLIPFYIPILILTALSLIIYSKESINYTKCRLIVFLIGVSVIIFSETTLKYIENTFYLNLKIFILPLVLLMIFYSTIFYLTQKK